MAPVNCSAFVEITKGVWTVGVVHLMRVGISLYRWTRFDVGFQIVGGGTGLMGSLKAPLTARQFNGSEEIPLGIIQSGAGAADEPGKSPATEKSKAEEDCMLLEILVVLNSEMIVAIWAVSFRHFLLPLTST